MFEKIFGIFRKRKKADISQDIPGDIGEDLFDVGDAEFGDDFDADTISLETGMSDGGFQSAPDGGIVSSEPGLADSGVGVESPFEEDQGMGFDVDEDMAGAMPADEGVSPLPEVEPAYAAPKAKRGGKGILVIIILAVVGLAAGFFLSTPPAVEQFKRIISSEPTLQEQFEQLAVDNAQLTDQLKGYRSVGTIDEILAMKAELAKRKNMAADMDAVNKKIADRPAVEERLDRTLARLKQTQRDLTIQEGALANVQKALKQIEARNNYFVASTNQRLEQMANDAEKSELLKSRLEPERVQRAETNAYASRDLHEGIEQTAFEALSSL